MRDIILVRLRVRDYTRRGTLNNSACIIKWREAIVTVKVSEGQRRRGAAGKKRETNKHLFMYTQQRIQSRLEEAR